MGAGKELGGEGVVGGGDLGELEGATELFDGGEGLVGDEEGVTQLLVGNGRVALGHRVFGLLEGEFVEGCGGELEGG